MAFMEADAHAAIADALRRRDLAALKVVLDGGTPGEIARLLGREDSSDRAVLYRVLPTATARAVFEELEPEMRVELFRGLRDEDTVRFFEELDPDDRAQLVDELPAAVARQLMNSLSPHEREITAPILGYPKRSIGRYMSPELVELSPHLTIGDALSHVRHRNADAETVYVLPVIDDQRKLVGIIGLRELVMGRADVLVGDVMEPARLIVHALDDAEEAARRIIDSRVLAAPVVNGEERLLGLVTVDDAFRIQEEAEDEDAARQGAAEPLRRPYLSTGVIGLVRSRVVWLLALAVSALLTVQVLGYFEDALEKVVTLALFVPLLTGTAGNTGAQAATTVTRALATGEVRPSDALLVLWREVRVGAVLGGLLGLLGFGLASLVFGVPLGGVIGLTLFAICTLAAAVGGVMPMIARLVRADPAVFSTPFISTFCDATSLVIYFLIATWILAI